MTGPLPPGFGNCPKMREVFCNNNQFEGSIPSAWGNMERCVQINLSDNLLTGSIPPELGNLTGLTNLILNDNSLSGEIPGGLFQNQSLRMLYLHDNQLEGSIPEEISRCTRLQYLFLHSNELSGPVPAGIVQDTSLKKILIHGNQLSDLPDLSALKYLTDLYVYENQFGFEDLVPNAGIQVFIYNPQDSIGTASDTTLHPGEPWVIGTGDNASSNVYQWFNNGTEIEDAAGAEYHIDAVSMSDAGTYHCRIGNTVLADMILYTRPVTVTVEENTGIAESVQAVPDRFALMQNYPNPFNPVTAIRFDVSEKCTVTLTVYNVLGQRVAILADRIYEPGEYQSVFYASSFGSGLYFYHIRMGEFQAVRKMIVME
ncbi:T9SS type A sorting domain-containing protein [bacterium]|nr:T9SS type A sorting domain-containing protein [bacterium]